MNLLDQYLAKLETRQINLGLGAVLLLACGAIGSFLAKPLYDRYGEISWELQSLRQIDYQSAGATLGALETRVAQLESSLLGDLQMIPTRELESHIIEALQNSAWRSNVELVSVEPLEKPDGLPYEEIAFRLEVQGHYFELDRWLEEVREQLGYVVFKEYAVKLQQVGGDDPLLHARLLLSAYRMESNS